MGQMIDTTFLSTMQAIGNRGHGKPILVIGRSNGAASVIVSRLHALHARFRIEENLYDGLGEVALDAQGWAVVLIQADDIGGLREARRAFSWLRVAAPGLRALILSSEIERNQIPDGDRTIAPVMLLTPVSQLSLQMGIETVLRDARHAAAPEFA